MGCIRVRGDGLKLVLIGWLYGQNRVFSMSYGVVWIGMRWCRVRLETEWDGSGVCQNWRWEEDMLGRAVWSWVGRNLEVVKLLNKFLLLMKLYHHLLYCCFTMVWSRVGLFIQYSTEISFELIWLILRNIWNLTSYPQTREVKHNPDWCPVNIHCCWTICTNYQQKSDCTSVLCLHGALL